MIARLAFLIMPQGIGEVLGMATMNPLMPWARVSKGPKMAAARVLVAGTAVNQVIWPAIVLSLLVWAKDKALSDPLKVEVSTVEVSTVKEVKVVKAVRVSLMVVKGKERMPWIGRSHLL